MAEGVNLIKKLDHPLALYVFSKDTKFQQAVLEEITSGGACINTSMEHLMNKVAPFGGVGPSGHGKYHGKYGFDEFSHHRTILTKSGSAPVLPPVEKHPA